MHPLIIHASCIMQPPPGMVLVSAEEAMRVRALGAAPTADPRWRQVYASVWGSIWRGGSVEWGVGSVECGVWSVEWEVGSGGVG
jgi:hypothetical protein